MDRSSLDELHEATPADPLTGPDLAGEVVAGTELDPVEESSSGSIIVDHSGDVSAERRHAAV